jgi:hypothetical protein
MMNFQKMVRMAAAVVLVPMITVQSGFAWGNEGHKLINRLAGENLPKDVPEFLRSKSAIDALGYYGPEPDRWKSRAEPELGAAGSPEHFIDLEWADLIGVPLPRNRYDFIRDLDAAQKTHPDIPLTPEKVGLQPWVTLEYWQRLKAAMRDYRELAAAHEDTKPVEAEIVFLAGIMGHFVADGSQPLHATIQFNGWTGPNPNAYSTSNHIHSKFESQFVSDNISPAKDVAPLVVEKPVLLGDVFDDYVAYLRKSNSLVEKLYQLDKAQGFDEAGTPEGKAFVDERLAAGATELRNMIYTAWIRSADPVPAWHDSRPARPATN